MASTKKKRHKKINYHGPHPFEFRLRVGRMYLEKRFPLSLISNETGVSDSLVQTWVRRYQEQGEERADRTKPDIFHVEKESLGILSESMIAAY